MLLICVIECFCVYFLIEELMVVVNLVVVVKFCKVFDDYVVFSGLFVFYWNYVEFDVECFEELVVVV